MYNIIINPASKSGRGMKIWILIEAELIRRDIEYQTFFTKGIGDATKIARDLTATSTDGMCSIIVLGGDGTMNEVVQGIVNFGNTQVSYIPTGSSNDLGRDLKIHKNPLEALAAVLDRPRFLSMDIGVMTYKQEGMWHQGPEGGTVTRRFCVSTGIGFDAAVCEEALSSRIKKVFNKVGLGKLTYLGIALKQLIMAPEGSARIHLDNHEPIVLKQFLFITGMIHKYEGGGFMFCPKADMCDGALDLCVVGHIPKWKALCILPTAFFGKHTGFQGVSAYRTKRVEVHTEKPVWVHVDGEVPGQTRDIVVTCEEQKLNLVY